MFTQLAKMLFLATFFPVVEDEEEDLNAEVPFEFVTVSFKIGFHVLKAFSRLESFELKNL